MNDRPYSSTTTGIADEAQAKGFTYTDRDGTQSYFLDLEKLQSAYDHFDFDLHTLDKRDVAGNTPMVYDKRGSGVSHTEMRSLLQNHGYLTALFDVTRVGRQSESSTPESFQTRHRNVID